MYKLTVSGILVGTFHTIQEATSTANRIGGYQLVWRHVSEDSKVARYMGHTFVIQI